jgi:hypothetical protein
MVSIENLAGRKIRKMLRPYSHDAGEHLAAIAMMNVFCRLFCS